MTDVVGQDVHAPGVEHRAAVLGHPVAHSLSPALHRAAYTQLGLGPAWAYGLQDVTAEELPAVVAQLDATWAGLSLTMPLKQAVIALLDVVDPLATAVGAVNTLVVQPGRGGSTGPLVGFNTDVHGIASTLCEAAAPGWRPEHAVVLGARATASSALAALGELGVTAPVLVGRSFAGPGSATLAAGRMGLDPVTRSWGAPEEIARALVEADVVVSTVPSGVADDAAAALAALVGVDPATARAGSAPGPLAGRVLLDVVYDPWPSDLVRVWTSAGGVVAPGWGMLLHQAEAQVRLMTGRTPDVDVMRAALTSAIDRRRTGGTVGEPPAPFRLPVR